MYNRLLRSPGIYERLVRPVLFQLDAESAHRVGVWALRNEWPWRWRPRVGSERLATTFADWSLASPIGLAAGFDKDGNACAGLRHLGFDYLCIGSILLAPSRGNPKPRLVRYPDRDAMANCYGLPSEGLDACVARLKRHTRGPEKLIANVHAETIADYLQMVAALAPHVDAVELGLRCPNSGERISLYPVAEFDALIGGLRDRFPGVRLIAKLPPFRDAAEKQNRIELVRRCMAFELTGVTIPGNYTIDEPGLSRGKGSLSGRPIFANMLAIVSDIASVTQGRIAIKATGGVFTGADAFQLLQAGATMIDIYTAFIYRGWDTANLIKRELLAAMDAHGIDRLADLADAPGRQAA